MKRLSMIDDMFLRLESRRQPFHIGMLLLFQQDSEDPLEFTHKLAEKLRHSTRMQAPFNRKLARKKGLHYWQDDNDFDLEQHFAHLALPAPGRIRELLAMISRVHGAHLDRAFPLWRIYLIEGLEDGRFAVYMKIHHALVDGVAGIRMLMNAMSTDQEKSTLMPAVWESQVSKPSSEADTTPVVSGLTSLLKFYRDSITSIIPIAKEVRESFDAWRKQNPNIVMAGDAPRCIFNQPVSASRRFAAQSYPTDRIRAVAKACDGTLNDVILAMCGGALRQYLMDLDALPEQSLVAAIPVSTRPANSGEYGNDITLTLTHLATHIDDAKTRLQAIKDCMDYNKQHLRALSSGQNIASAVLKAIPGAINTALNLRPNHILCNLVISHVPGPREPTYWQGARLDGIYPVSMLIDGAALNITIISRHDNVDFGLLACRKAVPRVQRILKYLEDALVELENAVAA